MRWLLGRWWWWWWLRMRGHCRSRRHQQSRDGHEQQRRGAHCWIAYCCAGNHFVRSRKSQLGRSARRLWRGRDWGSLATSFAPSLLTDVGPFASLVRGADEAVTQRPVLLFLVQLLYHSYQFKLLFPISETISVCVSEVRYSFSQRETRSFIPRIRHLQFPAPLQQPQRPSFHHPTHERPVLLLTRCCYTAK